MLYGYKTNEEIKNLITEINQLTCNLIIKMQYLEEHLQTALYCKIILSAFNQNKTLTKNEFVNAKLKSEEIYQQLSSKTLGSVIATAKDYNLLETDINGYEELQSILEKRNHLVHKFFVESDYLAKTDNILYLKSRITYLSDFSIIVESFLQKLTSIANLLLKEISKIKGKKEL